MNAKNGTYYIYKKSGDKTVEVAYFTLERLNAVIAEYATDTVKAYYWWEKDCTEAYEGNTLYGLIADKIFIGYSVNLADHANYLIDGTPHFGLTFATEGEHVLTVFDDYGNSYEYTLVIVRTVPDILYSLGGDTWNTATADRQYAFSGAVTVTISDTLDGGFAMYIIRNSAGETLRVLSMGEEFVLDKSGRYTVSAVNHGGQSAEVQFLLSLDKPTVMLDTNADSKRLEIKIQPSMDSNVTLTDIRIYISTDGGSTWTMAGKDDYGKTINANGLSYAFNKDGLYKVVVEDNFRSGIGAVIETIDYVKPAPEGTLNGVEDGGSTNGSVKFTWTDEATARLTYGGKITDYVSGTELTEEGVYLLEFKDTNGYSQIYTFVINKTAPVGELSGTADGGVTNKSVTLTFTDDGTVGTLHTDDKHISAYVSGAEITEDGAYKIVLTDKASNTSEYTFTIDTVKPEAILSGVDNGGQTGGSVTLKNPNKQCDIKAYLNGAEMSYAFGDTLDKEGSYKIILTDSAGNETVYEFSIVYAVNAAGTVIIIIVIIAVFGGIILVWLMRKRKVFKKK